ncbi:hypothetical protein [Leeia sp.]|uniref:hypothetical protein n=1 Tax=Leeia sp. TaxID=2884678 RepID=UPI0035B2E1F5
MSLSALIKKRSTGNLATAIPAISATHPKGEARTVAKVATVAVANPMEEKTAPWAKVSAGDTATCSRWWLIHYSDRDSLQLACCPEATHAEILEQHLDAVVVEPFTPTIRQPPAPLDTREESAIRAWLVLIGETDQATIAEVIGQCQRDADAREYFTRWAASESPKLDPFTDDRRRCSQCLNLRGRVCTIAKPGGLVSSNVGYRPVLDTPQRCAGYQPTSTDNNQQPGIERWPGLIQQGGE